MSLITVTNVMLLISTILSMADIMTIRVPEWMWNTLVDFHSGDY